LHLTPKWIGPIDGIGKCANSMTQPKQPASDIFAGITKGTGDDIEFLGRYVYFRSFSASKRSWVSASRPSVYSRESACFPEASVSSGASVVEMPE
jgi:hypothetical protein